jgi:16S rRNA (cytidine1402-2'-O)-methyltransferase
MNLSISTATLWLIPTSLSSHDHAVLSPHDMARINHLRHFIVETEKTARAALKHLQLGVPIMDLALYSLNEHTCDASVGVLLQPMREGKDLGLLSDAGCPVIADPGAKVIHLAHQEGFRVVPLVGPSSILLALMASGAWGQKFTFHGYLPVDEQPFGQTLKFIAEDVFATKTTHIFIETPYRNQKIWERMLTMLPSNMFLSVSCALTSNQEFVATHAIETWKQIDCPNFHKQPCVFTLYTS